MSANVNNDGFGKNWSDKLRLLDAIDDMREPVRPREDAALQIDPNQPTIEMLQEKLRCYEQTCAMLEREVQELEQQTIAAIAEAGRLRHELDKHAAERVRPTAPIDYVERDSISRVIRDSENERRLLLDALENSEAELARMVKTLDLVARKLQVA
ncbi:MAG: hypothetical protein LIQ31_01125 [Planctomycetes bacterium]|nr:hypothetical protein [Planctomycetota bacterium]